MARQDRIAPGEALWDWIGAQARDEAIRQLEREGWRAPPTPEERGSSAGWAVIALVALAMLAGLWWGFTGGRHEGPTRLQEWNEIRSGSPGGPSSHPSRP
ncbi:hypothetical protein [Sphingomicrobium astaxanthinifaciens]|uniref:hypothetical protein n=1 Tax=Sphingomicrobium astaxanthinifaciens TaxID=1227949 RepID=UPI001FCAF64A|nr:hypothetical protein [Sphingomicrobium astaxanthinifaciens]MCJ7421468.1 hypothetical protein [Sphingomicrobium astaxanthinifaciens]